MRTTQAPYRNPATIPRAIEEFLRRYSIPTVARSLLGHGDRV